MNDPNAVMTVPLAPRVRDQAPQATAVMTAAANDFYTSSRELNELDPKVPPDWVGIDDELGNNPYPG